MNRISRRNFVRGSLAATAGLAFVSGCKRRTRVKSPNEEVVLGIIGVGKKGSSNFGMFRKMEGVRIAAVCDVDPDYKLTEAMKKYYPDGKNVPVVYTDFRRILDDKSIDAVVVSTPNYWHTPITILACQAGKDVYVEKPISHNIFEGRVLVNAEKKYDRIIQHGTQNRSDTGLIPAMEYVHAGNIGAIEYVHTQCYRRRKSIGKTYGPQPLPSTVNYDLWCGPTPFHPLRRTKLHYDWHWDYETGNGDLGNQGVHETDLALWALQKNELPSRVISLGGRFGYDDDANTPNTMIAVLDYKPAPIICEVRNLPRSKEINGMDANRGIRTGIIIQCKDGYFAGGRGGGWIYDNDGNKVKYFDGDHGKNHQQNFIDCVRSRKRSDLRTNPLEAHISASLCHMTEISYRLGNHATPEQATEAISKYPAAVEVWERVQSHLAKNDVDLAKTPITLGPWLDFDPVTEKFKQEDEYGLGRWANKIVRPQYRKPFVVTEKI